MNVCMRAGYNTYLITMQAKVSTPVRSHRKGGFHPANFPFLSPCYFSFPDPALLLGGTQLAPFSIHQALLLGDHPVSSIFPPQASFAARGPPSQLQFPLTQLCCQVTGTNKLKSHQLLLLLKKISFCPKQPTCTRWSTVLTFPFYVDSLLYLFLKSTISIRRI